MPRTRSPSSPAYTSSASPAPTPDRLAPPVPTTSSTIFSGVEPGPPATDTAPDRHTRMPKSAAKRRQPRRLPPLTSPMKHRGQDLVHDAELRIHEHDEDEGHREHRDQRRHVEQCSVEAHLPHIAVHRHGEQQRSEEHTSELQSRGHLVCRLLLEKK